MVIEEIQIEDLIESEYNPRTLTKEQKDQLTESIGRFGFVDPIIVNNNPERMNVVIGGHQRLRVAKEMGFKTVPVVYKNLDLPLEKELNLRLNKNVGSWDMDILANQFPEEMLLQVGFSDFELHGFVEPPAPIPESQPKKRFRLKCLNCGFDGTEDKFDKIEEGSEV